MKIEIWSDILCPFCYIGKRKFELALEKFPNKAQVQIEWKSFQLDANMEAQPAGSIDTYLAERKGFSIEQAKQLNQQVTSLAAEVGLRYQFDIAIPNNSLLAHRLLHFAKQQGKQNEMKERLLQAYFTKGENIGDIETLSSIAASLGLDKEEVKSILTSDAYENEVQLDQYHAQQIGVGGVPFFVFNNKYAVSGAQAPETFTEVLEKVWKEEQEEPSLTTIQNSTTNEAASCDIEGNC